MIFTADCMQKKIKKKNKKVLLMSAISIWERLTHICFIVSVIVACYVVRFSVEFQSNSVNNGRVSEGWICITFVPVKYSRVVIAHYYCSMRILLYWPCNSLPWVLIALYRDLRARIIHNDKSWQCVSLPLVHVAYIVILHLHEHCSM